MLILKKLSVELGKFRWDLWKLKFLSLWRHFEVMVLSAEFAHAWLSLKVKHITWIPRWNDVESTVRVRVRVSVVSTLNRRGVLVGNSPITRVFWYKIWKSFMHGPRLKIVIKTLFWRWHNGCYGWCHGSVIMFLLIVWKILKWFNIFRNI